MASNNPPEISTRVSTVPSHDAPVAVHWEVCDVVCRTPADGAAPHTYGVPTPAAGCAVLFGSWSVVLDPRLGVLCSASLSSVLAGRRAMSRPAERRSRPNGKIPLKSVAHGACTCMGCCALPPCAYRLDLLPYPVSSLQPRPPCVSETFITPLSPVNAAPAPLAPDGNLSCVCPLPAGGSQCSS